MAQELKATIAYIREFPAAGQLVAGQRSDAYRVLLNRVRYLVYYREVNGTIEVLALWHASRGERPKL